MLVDTHSHIHDARFDSDRDEVIARARGAGVDTMISVGTDLETSRAAIALAEHYSFIYATVGVHPHDVKDMTAASLDELAVLAAHPRVVAYGEIGLDYYYDRSPREIQREGFRNQLRVARSVDLPVVIHTRDAQEDTLAILTEEWKDQPGVFHCFTGDPEYATLALQLGFMISFSGIVTFPKATELREAVRVVPLDRLLIETDCPYLAPVPYRGKRNEPSYLSAVAAIIAAEKSPTSLEEISRVSSDNAKRLFGIGASS